MKIEQEILTPVPGLTRDIGFYLAGLQEVRAQIVAMVSDLTAEELAARPLPTENCIGALLLHIAENDFWWIQSLVGGAEMTDELKADVHWDVLEVEDFTALGYSTDFVLAEIMRISEGSKQTLAKFSDDDMEKLFAFDGRTSRVDCSLRWILHHLIDHEAHHKGQIALLKKLIRNGQK
jgi:uncharacterized damage-inducible protein DinB